MGTRFGETDCGGWDAVERSGIIGGGLLMARLAFVAF